LKRVVSAARIYRFAPSHDGMGCLQTTYRANSGKVVASMRIGSGERREGSATDSQALQRAHDENLKTRRHAEKTI